MPVQSDGQAHAFSIPSAQQKSPQNAPQSPGQTHGDSPASQMKFPQQIPQSSAQVRQVSVD